MHKKKNVKKTENQREKKNIIWYEHNSPHIIWGIILPFFANVYNKHVHIHSQHIGKAQNSLRMACNLLWLLAKNWYLSPFIYLLPPTQTQNYFSIQNNVELFRASTIHYVTGFFFIEFKSCEKETFVSVCVCVFYIYESFVANILMTMVIYGLVLTLKWFHNSNISNNGNLYFTFLFEIIKKRMSTNGKIIMIMVWNQKEKHSFANQILHTFVLHTDISILVVQA